MASPDEMADIEWSTEALDLVPIEEGQAEFGHYVLCYEIASGGMGTVYLAREQLPGGFTRPIAIKRIHPHLAKKRQFVDMFLDEARVAARIIHPNVCSVYGFGQVGGTHYIAMEYLVGQPLSELAPRIALRPELAGSPRWHAIAAPIIADACEGLHAAHELRDDSGQLREVVHRDVSTHNVFVTYDGAVKLLDFGIARATGRNYETRTGTVKGKLAYMSPEQARAQKAIDRRSDVWSLGVVLWELLALRRMFGRRSDIELLRAVTEEPIVPPSLVRPEVPPELDAIVLRALERDVEKRYPSARAMARDLGAFVSKSGEATSLGELADMLAELFRHEREGKLVAVATVLHTSTSDRLVSDVSARAPSPPVDEAPTHQIALPEEREVSSPPPPAVSEHHSRTSTPMIAPERSSRATLWLPLAAVALLLSVALGAGVAWLTFGTRTEEPLRVTSLREAPEPPRAVETEPAPPPEPEPPPPPPESEPQAPPPIAAEEPPPVEPARPQFGRVNVAATGGWAEIYVHGRFVARTPRVIRLPAGRQVIELRPNGDGPPRRVTVDVRPGAESRVVVPLR